MSFTNAVAEGSVPRHLTFPMTQRRWEAFLFTFVDPFSEPALIYGVDGRLVVRNRAAAARFPAPPEDIAAARALPSARCVGLELDGTALDLVVFPIEPRKTSSVNLPESLARVAELAATGLSDKEISEKTGLSLSSTRTYVARLYRRLGVRSRTELARYLQAARGVPANSP